MEQDTQVRRPERTRPRRWEERHVHDRWRWRRAIRSDPRKYRVYRIVVGVVGGLLVLLGLSTGWLPGPGGIPLTLLGLAVLASEFQWAHRLLQRTRVQVRRFGDWSARQPRWLRWLGGVAAFVAVAATLTWLLLLWLGVPGWLPDSAASLLGMLPGVG